MAMTRLKQLHIAQLDCADDHPSFTAAAFFVSSPFSLQILTCAYIHAVNVEENQIYPFPCVLKTFSLLSSELV
jgi:hypothetical protein